jgi:hypothetical protein
MIREDLIKLKGPSEEQTDRINAPPPVPSIVLSYRACIREVAGLQQALICKQNLKLN